MFGHRSNEYRKKKLNVQVNFAEDEEKDCKEIFVIEEEGKQPGKSKATDDKEKGIEGDMVGDVIVICSHTTCLRKG